MDYLRFGYDVTMRVNGSDPKYLLPVRWFQAKPGAPALPFPAGQFGSSIWGNVDFVPGQLGEQPTPRRKWVRFNRPNDRIGYPCGDMSTWYAGVPADPLLPKAFPDFPGCCFGGGIGDGGPPPPPPWFPGMPCHGFPSLLPFGSATSGPQGHMEFVGQNPNNQNYGDSCYWSGPCAVDPYYNFLEFWLGGDPGASFKTCWLVLSRHGTVPKQIGYLKVLDIPATDTTVSFPDFPFYNGFIYAPDTMIVPR